VVPFAGDQFFWAERLRQAGVAPAAVNGRRPTAEAIARALDFAADARVRNRARVLGEAMHPENGIVNAVAVIERMVATSSRVPAEPAQRLA
jgi:UDP:flavonoid glycosyltransferase YjiC (YdhE family)